MANIFCSYRVCINIQKIFLYQTIVEQLFLAMQKLHWMFGSSLVYIYSFTFCNWSIFCFCFIHLVAFISWILLHKASILFFFLRYTEKGEDRTRGDDITRFLGGELKKDRKQIRSKLQRQPYWYHIPLTTVKENLDYLRREKFTDEDIFKSLQIVLYPV